MYLLSCTDKKKNGCECKKHSAQSGRLMAGGRRTWDFTVRGFMLLFLAALAALFVLSALAASEPDNSIFDISQGNILNNRRH